MIPRRLIFKKLFFRRQSFDNWPCAVVAGFASRAPRRVRSRNGSTFGTRRAHLVKLRATRTRQTTLCGSPAVPPRSLPWSTKRPTLPRRTLPRRRTLRQSRARSFCTLPALLALPAGSPSRLAVARGLFSFSPTTITRRSTCSTPEKHTLY